MTAVDDFLQATIARFIDAERSLHSGDVAGRLAMWSAHDPVTLFGAAAPSRSGRDQVEPVFRWLASRFAACNAYDLELVAAGASGDLAYTVAHEHYEALTNDGSVVRTTLRATHVYRREGGEWKIVHRHGDHPPVDQTPPDGDPPPAIRGGRITPLSREERRDHRRDPVGALQHADMGRAGQDRQLRGG